MKTRNIDPLEKSKSDNLDYGRPMWVNNGGTETQNSEFGKEGTSKYGHDATMSRSYRSRLNEEDIKMFVTGELDNKYGIHSPMKREYLDALSKKVDEPRSFEFNLIDRAYSWGSQDSKLDEINEKLDKLESEVKNRKYQIEEEPVSKWQFTK